MSRVSSSSSKENEQQQQREAEDLYSGMEEGLKKLDPQRGTPGKAKGKVKIAVNTLHRMQTENPGRSFTSYNLIVELHERKNMTYPTAEQAVSKAIEEGFIPYDEEGGTLGAV